MSKRPFIIDCDTGTDDAIAILAAYGCPDMDILAITSVNGNVAEKYGGMIGVRYSVMKGARILR